MLEKGKELIAKLIAQENHKYTGHDIRGEFFQIGTLVYISDSYFIYEAKGHRRKPIIPNSGRFALILEHSRGNFYSYTLLKIHEPDGVIQVYELAYYASSWYDHKHLEFLQAPTEETKKLCEYYVEVKSGLDDEEDEEGYDDEV